MTWSPLAPCQPSAAPARSTWHGPPCTVWRCSALTGHCAARRSPCWTGWGSGCWTWWSGGAESCSQNSAQRPWLGVPSQAVQAIRQDGTTTPGEFCEPLLFGNAIGQQAVVLFLDNLVALAGAPFQPRAIQHIDAPPGIADEPRTLQLEGRLRHAFAPHAQHVGDQLLRHHQLVALQAVQAQQQPAAQLLVQRMVAVAHGGPRQLSNERLRVAQQQRS